MKYFLYSVVSRLSLQLLQLEIPQVCGFFSCYKENYIYVINVCYNIPGVVSLGCCTMPLCLSLLFQWILPELHLASSQLSYLDEPTVRQLWFGIMATQVVSCSFPPDRIIGNIDAVPHSFQKWYFLWSFMLERKILCVIVSIILRNWFFLTAWTLIILKVFQFAFVIVFIAQTTYVKIMVKAGDSFLNILHFYPFY